MKSKKYQILLIFFLLVMVIAVVVTYMVLKNENSAEQMLNDTVKDVSSDKEEISQMDEKKLAKLTELANAAGITDADVINQIAGIPELAEISDTEAEQKYPTMTYIGHASVKLKSMEGDVIYIDPYYPGDYSEPADYILITHGHSDHNNIAKCTQNTGCQVIHWYDALIDGEYQTFTFDHLSIEAVPSGDNANHKLNDNVGYIVTLDGVSVFHAGDTSMNDGKKVIAGKNIDYAMYPVDGVYNMGPKEAAEVADLIGAEHNIPIHGDKNHLIEQVIEFAPKGKLVVIFGQTIDLKPKE